MTSYTALALWVDGYSITPYKVTRYAPGVRKKAPSDWKIELNFETKLEFSLQLAEVVKKEIEAAIPKNGLDFLLIIGPDDMKLFAAEYVMERFSDSYIEVSDLAKEDGKKINSMLDAHFYEVTYGSQGKKKCLAKPAKKPPGGKKKLTQPLEKHPMSKAK